MQINISGTTTLKQIAELFHSTYNYLKLQFYLVDDNGQRKKITELDKPLIEFDCIIPDGIATVHYWQTTESTEQILSKQIGLQVEICRRYLDKWVVTNGSDRLTLEEQNLMGAASTRNYFEI